MFASLKPVVCIDDISTTNAATATGLIDTKPDNGYKSLHLMVKQGTSNSTSNKLTVCKLEESDTSNGTFTAIPAYTGGTATSTSVGFVIPAAHATAQQKYYMAVDLRGRKRWLKLSLSPVTTQILGASGFLGRGEQTPPPVATGDLALIVGG
jgi:hypothetical protein